MNNKKLRFECDLMHRQKFEYRRTGCFSWAIKIMATIILAPFIAAFIGGFLGVGLPIGFVIVCLLIPFLAFRKYSATKIELKEFQDGSDVWFNWVEKALKAKQLNETPVLEKNSEINACIVRNFPEESRSDQYEFSDVRKSELFCVNHRGIIIKHFRQSLYEESGGLSLGLGQLEFQKDKILLIFRQVSDECAVFFTVQHLRTGSVVNLISKKWFLFNRKAAKELGRDESDQEAILIGRNRADWRENSKWGVLGIWYLVHRNKNVADNVRDDFCLPNSELMYYEKIVHVESVKKH